MHVSRRVLAVILVTGLALACRTARADDLSRILHELDLAAANFHSTIAEFEFDTIVTDPVPDKDVQKGTAYYERRGNDFSMAAHIAEVDGRPVPKIYMYAHGALRLDEPLINQVTTFKSASKFESYVMLGFGASGKELADKWDIKYLGPETLGGIKTEKLELVAKDPQVRKNLPKVTVWLDTARAVSLKQDFDEGQGTTRVCTYSHILVNQSLPSDAFKLKTDTKTQYVEH